MPNNSRLKGQTSHRCIFFKLKLKGGPDTASGFELHRKFMSSGPKSQILPSLFLSIVTKQSRQRCTIHGDILQCFLMIFKITKRA